ncbi:MAG: 4-hydroxythreonine-4-phosphate dehydrogenase PdxA [Planctomycetota bacterium]
MPTQRTLPNLPLLAVTCGDPAGIGPEVAVRAVRSAAARGARWVLVGPDAVWNLAGAPSDWPVVATPDRLHAVRARVMIFNRPAPARLPTSGRSTPVGATVALDALAAATDLLLSAEVAGMVTAPLCKATAAKIQPGFVGHTEYLEARVRELRPQARALMLLEGGGLRVALATTHLPLRAVPDALARLGAKGLAAQIRTLAEGLRRDYGLATPRLGVTGLNPHAGEGGLLGDEEINIIEPAIRLARSPLWRVEGPLPGDTAPYLMRQGRFDALLAMHHDQGLAPLKLAGFAEGINVTLGLNIVRTSPDHGTAFDIAGRGQADPRSMQAALRRAVGFVALGFGNT